MSRQTTQPRTQLVLKLECATAAPPVTPGSQELLEALADLLLSALSPEALTPGEKDGGDES